ncbi:SpaH/EbpB family LPXTG-anchored major pilin [Mediterraneibacter faecis]|uniref:SpaH/EbpB family LPXTG-anchored major pilin n=1 Tax=Mediterraneibacter faecis TaxID=592978 RepID=UPI003F8B26B3
MKIIKKIAAIMLSVMMVLGMCSVVGAEETSETSATKDGKITITNAVPKQKYTIYQILELESFSDKTAENPGNYAYKATTKWKGFVESETGETYLKTDGSGYVTWVENADPVAFAKAALAYAKDPTNSIVAEKSANAPDATEGSTTSTVTFNNLDLGYYLVDSSLGALCDLTTTNLNVEILEKNGVPTVDKKVYEGNNLQNFNYANIGDTVTFETTVEVKKGASNYKLYDKMSTGFQLKENSAPISTLTIIAYNTEGKMLDELTQDQDYTFEKTKDGFTVEFKNTYLKQHENVDYIIKVAYNAILTGDATIGKDPGNTNTAWVTYGDNNTKSTDSVTNTYTFGIPVFKYTGTDTALAEAKFSLHSEQTCVDANRIDLIKVGETETYRRFITGDADASKVTAITTTSTGKFSITGLKPGTYYLKEIAAPKGYNVLAKPVKIEVTSEGTIKVVNGTAMEQTNEVKVKNNAGSLLPSTGGMGTTVFYIAGALLVLISGVVLIAKKRTDSK